MSRKARTIFVTGTDTGVGKTLLTALLLCHLRQSGVHALAMKPFCSGGTADVDLLYALQDRELSRSEINPFYFREPIAPLLAARIHRRPVRLPDVMKKIDRVRRTLPSTRDPRPSTLLIEGSGGLLVPLGEDYTVLDLISNLNADVIVVSRNRLGTINHTLLTVQTLQAAGKKRMTVVLMDQQAPDLASKSNQKILSELLAPIPLVQLPYFGPNMMGFERVNFMSDKHAATLSKIVKSLN